MIAIDAMVLVYAGIVPQKERDDSASLKALQTKAKILLHMCREQMIVLSTIAVSEILVPVPTKDKGKLISVLSEQFVLADFNCQAASIASDLWAEHKKLPKDQQYKKRAVLKADCMIVASVKAVGATKFYTSDKNCRKIANLTMSGYDLPKEDPTDMFLKKDIENGDF